MIRISLVFDHYKRTKKGEMGPVEVRVTVNRKPLYINTGVRVHEGRLVGNCIKDIKVKCDDSVVRMTEDADMLNERLTTIVGIVENEVNRCLENRMPLDVKAIRNKVWGLETEEKDDEPTMIMWIKSMAASANILKNTKLRYITLCNKLTAYGKMTRWEHLTVDNIYAWDVWLRGQKVPLSENQKEAGVEPATISNQAVYNYHKCLKAMIHRAIKFDVITFNPYDKLRGVFKKPTMDVVDYLTTEQMQKVLALTPVPGSQVAMARDLFIFQMFTGLGYADTQVFDLSQYKMEIVDGIDGEKTERWRYVGERVKTGVPYVSQLLPPVVDVLKRNGWRVPKMNNQRYNQMLKAIGMCIGIEKLHSHMGRHSFATWMLENDVPIEHVSKMLGHTNITQTQRYAQVQAKDIYSDFDRMAEKMIAIQSPDKKRNKKKKE